MILLRLGTPEECVYFWSIINQRSIYQSCGICQTPTTSAIIRDLHSNEMLIFFAQVLHHLPAARIIRGEGTGLSAETTSGMESNVQNQKAISA